MQHIPHSAAKTQRPPFRCSPRPSEVPRGRGQKCEDYPAQEPGAAPEHLGQIVGKSGVNASARSVRGSRPRPARNKLSGAYAQALITRRSGSLHRVAFGRTPAFFPTFFSGKIFRRVCAESSAQLQRLHRHPPGGGGTLFRQRSPSAVSFLVARSCIASCAALDRLTRFQRQYAYSG